MSADLNQIQTALQPTLSASNINPVSFLATDYLNHYNEIVMLLEMVPDMPDMLEDVLDWAPKSYPDHFMESGFAARELAVEAYENAPTPYRDQFDAFVAEIDLLLTSTLYGLQAVGVVERGFSMAARTLLVGRIAQAQALMGRLNGVIHGKIDHDISTLNAQISVNNADEEEEEMQSQEDIDALFD